MRPKTRNAHTPEMSEQLRLYSEQALKHFCGVYVARFWPYRRFCGFAGCEFLKCLKVFWEKNHPRVPVFHPKNIQKLYFNKTKLLRHIWGVCVARFGPCRRFCGFARCKFSRALILTTDVLPAEAKSCTFIRVLCWFLITSEVSFSDFRPPRSPQRRPKVVLLSEICVGF